MPPSVAALHQIPPPPQTFTGRTAELNELLTERNQGNANLFGLYGMGGVGKTALARKLAEQLAQDYPDAHLNLDLKGNSQHPLTIAAAMVYVIRSFHPKVELPESEDAIAGMYQSILHGQRALLLLENAGSSAQVEALIPPRSCALIVTSRQRLAVAGMVYKNLQVLPSEDAQALLLMITPRIGNEARSIADLCGNLPFALRLAAGVLATQVDLSPAEYVRRLSGARQQLQLIEASLSLSYELLHPEMKILWCALSVFPNTFDLEAAADIWRLEANIAFETMSTLVTYNLVEWDPSLSRYRLHDLVRVFADYQLSEADRRQYKIRFFNHYLEVFFRADQLYRQAGEATKRGLNLYDLEKTNIQAAQSWVMAHAEDDDIAAEVCANYPLHGGHLLRLRVHPLERIRLYETALAAARRLGLRDIEGTHLYTMGLTYLELGDSYKAIELTRQYLVIARELNDPAREAAALSALGQANENIGHYRRAIVLYNRALSISRNLGDRRSESTELLYLGQAYRNIGEGGKAESLFVQALNIAHELGIRQNEGSALACLAERHLHHGCTQAFSYSEQALSIFREIGYEAGEAGVLDYLGQLHAKTGNPSRGIEFLNQSLEIHRRLDDPIGENKSLGNIGLAYAAQGNHRTAIDYYQEQLGIAQRINDRHSEGNALINMAKAYIGLGEANIAIDLCIRAMNIFRMIGSYQAECGGYATLGEAYHLAEDTEHAIESYEHRVLFARRINHVGCEAESYLELGRVFYEIGSRAEAIICAQAALLLHERTNDAARASEVRNQIANWMDY